MDDFILNFKSKVDVQKVRESFPEISDSEVPIWFGSPTVMSMAAKYLLAALVLMTHMIFFWAAKFEDIDGEGNANLVIGIAKSILDFSGVLGFVIVMFAIAKINHFLNVSSSGNWTTTWLIINGCVPFVIVLFDWSGKILGYFMDDIPDTPMWMDWYYPLLGIISFVFAVSMTTHYRNSFQYAITDKRVHIRKKFLYFDTSSVGIPFEKVENLKVEPPLIGRILGFGNVYIITDGRQSSYREANDSASKSIFSNSILSRWILIQRNFSVSSEDPSECLYCINEPMLVYRLINELIDNS